MSAKAGDFAAAWVACQRMQWLSAAYEDALSMYQVGELTDAELDQVRSSLDLVKSKLDHRVFGEVSYEAGEAANRLTRTIKNLERVTKARRKS